MKANNVYVCFILTTAIFLNSCVQETHPKTIHFKLDMRNESSIKNVGVRGNTASLKWDKTLLLSDDNNDSIYEGIIKLNSASFDIEFKFVSSNDNFELQDQLNRSIHFEYKPESIVYQAIFNNSKDIQILKNN